MKRFDSNSHHSIDYRLQKRLIVIISDIEFQLGPKHFVKNLLRLKKSTYF